MDARFFVEVYQVDVTYTLKEQKTFRRDYIMAALAPYVDALMFNRGRAAFVGEGRRKEIMMALGRFAKAHPENSLLYDNTFVMHDKVAQLVESHMTNPATIYWDMQKAAEVLISKEGVSEGHYIAGLILRAGAERLRTQKQNDPIVITTH